MLANWSLVVADFHREYGVDSDALRAMSSLDFHLRLGALSSRSRFLAAWDRQPKHLHDPAERAALMAAARR